MKCPSFAKTYSFFAIFTLVFLVWPIALYPAEIKDTFYPAMVKDISDRAYEPAVIDLLDNAQDSIVLSMYIIKPSEKGPVDLLIKDLMEALDRGVSVEVYLNTKFHSAKAVKVFERKSFRLLREKGAKIYLSDSRYRLHDKLIIMDSRYVIDGSHNWSVSALKSNFESATLIDSPELAREKLRRLKDIPLEGAKSARLKEPRVLKKVGVLQENISVKISADLLEDKNLFPGMVTAHDNRSMDTYLLLLAEAERIRISGDISEGDRAFPLSLEDMAFTLKMPSSWSNTAGRRQVIKTLRKLKNRYGLIDFEFQHGKDAWIILKELPGEVFTVKSNILDPNFLASKSATTQFVLLVKMLLEEEGKSLDSFTRKELTERFHIGGYALRKGIRKIEDNE